MKLQMIISKTSTSLKCRDILGFETRPRRRLMLAGALLGAVALSGCGTLPPDVGRGRELRVLQTQACDRSYIDDARILTNATTNNHLKVMYGGVMLGPHTGDEPTMIAVARNLGAQGANLKNLANDLSGKRAKGDDNASQGPFWRAYKHGMTQGQWRITNVSLSGQIVGNYFNEMFPAGRKASSQLAR